MRKVNGHNMAANNFKVFNESKTNIMNDTEYGTHIQRKNGVGSGVAISALHNKLYRQTSIAAKAVADFIASQGLDATDNDSTLFSTNLIKALEKVTKIPLDGHRTQEVLDHPDQSVTTAKVKDLAITEGKLAKDSVTEAKIKDLSVTTRKLNDKSVTMAKVDDEVKKYLVDTYIKKSGDSIDGDLIFKGSKGSIYFNPNNSVSAKVYVNNNGTLDIGVNNSANGAVDNIALCSMNKPKWYNKDTGPKNLATEEDVTNAVSPKVSKAGDTMTGNLTLDTTSSIIIKKKEGTGSHTIGDGGSNGGNTNLDVGSYVDTPQANLCCYQRPGWYGKDKSSEFHPFALADDISITTGWVSDGQPVPIPSGYNRNECTILLSLAKSNSEGIYVDIRESGISNCVQVECWLSDNGAAHVGMWWRNNEGYSHSAYGGSEGRGDKWMPGEATYICIAKKGA